MKYIELDKLLDKVFLNLVTISDIMSLPTFTDDDIFKKFVEEYEDEDCIDDNESDFGSTPIYKFDGINSASVYIGGMDSLKCVNRFVKWHLDEDIPKQCGGNEEYITPNELIEQFPKKIITVIIDEPLHGEIWQYGNYHERKWFKIGTTQGYA